MTADPVFELYYNNIIGIKLCRRGSCLKCYKFMKTKIKLEYCIIFLRLPTGKITAANSS